MAIVTAKRGVLDMSDLGFDRDGTATATSSNIRLSYTDGGYTDFGGAYTFGPGGSINGTVESISNIANGKVTFTVDDVNADAQRLFAYIDAGDIQGAEAYVLRDDDTIDGAGRADKLYGFGGNDSIQGHGGADTLVGGEGQDKLAGGEDADRFVYLSDEDSGTTAQTRDIIFGFSHTDGDVINLKAIDANEHTKHVNDKFTLVDHFTGHAGELTITHLSVGYLVSGDTDGTDGADFTILVKSDTALVAADFML